MRNHKHHPFVGRIAVVGLLVLSIQGIALCQFERENLGLPTPGATANFRFAEASELPITVSLLGAVHRPGRYEISRKIDLVNLLALAGGWLESADMSDVHVSRLKPNGAPGSRIDLSIDLDNIADVSPEFLQLQDGDNVFVGGSGAFTMPVILSIIATAATVVTALAYLGLAN
jgi:protein involved in polysaccharide export with SLBB domain